MPSKRIVVIVFVGIILIWSFSFIIHLYETRVDFKIENLPYKEIRSIEIDDRGIFGNKIIFINNKDTLEEIAKILKFSKVVEWESINLKSSNGLCELKINFNNSTSTTLVVSNTSSSGGIVSSGDYYYRNDKLLDFVINVLKTSR